MTQIYHGSRRVAQPVTTQATGTTANRGGGYAFKTDWLDQITRFIILGTEGGDYYSTQNELTAGAIAFAEQVFSDRDKARQVLDLASNIRSTGRAYRHDTQILMVALGLESAFPEVKKYAIDLVPVVCRTGTDILHLAAYIHTRRGWGRAVRKAFSIWYNGKTAESLSYQMAKYQSRDEWSHADIIRLAHIKPIEDKVNQLFRWAMKQDAQLFGFAEGLELAMKAESAEELARLIIKYNLTKEMVPNQFFKSDCVWDALIENMGMIALTRNLAAASTYLSKRLNVWKYLERMTPERVSKEQVHPLQLLLALKTYSQGHGFKGTNSWNAIPEVMDKLESLFNGSWDTLPKSNKKIFIAVDCSGSMTSSIAGTNVSSSEAAAVLAMQVAKTCTDWEVKGFSGGRGYGKSSLKEDLVDLPIRPDTPFKQLARCMQLNTWGYTNPGAAIQYMLDSARGGKKKIFDAVVIITDSEANAGIHPHQLLAEYRRQYNPSCKYIIVNTAASNITLVPPNDIQALGVVGFDTNFCNLIFRFIEGEL